MHTLLLNRSRTVGSLAYLCAAAVVFIMGAYATTVEAATLRVTPSTGVYTVGSTFTVSVLVDSAGASINAAEGTLSFNPREVSVVAVSRSSSIFNLWVAEPSFSNAAGTISFSGGSPTGYKGSAGSVMSITLRATTAGSPRITFSQGSVLANDGRGTNVLTNMSGGSFTVGAEATTPVAEVIEYVAPANTPGTPVISSKTHGDPAAWYKLKEAALTWTLPTGVTEVRTLLDTRSSSIPTKVYETPISAITLPDLPEGVSYFHLQFKNADGWGKVAHYRLAVDSERPSEFTITQPENVDRANPEQVLTLAVKDSTSKVLRFMVKIDNEEPFEYVDEEATGQLKLPKLLPGYHAFIIEAFDEAGNSIVASYSLTIDAFDAPHFTEYPTEMNDGIIPVIRGTSRPNAQVNVTLQRVGAEPETYQVASDDRGVFTFIPSGAFTTGVYQLSARATDQFGAQSQESEIIRIAVQQPGLLRIGSLLVSALAVVISLVAMVVLLVLGSVFLVGYLRRFRRQVTTESKEALAILKREFATLDELLRSREALLLESRKAGRLTKAESDMILSLRESLRDAERRVEKEVVDVERVANGDTTKRH